METMSDDAWDELIRGCSAANSFASLNRGQCEGAFAYLSRTNTSITQQINSITFDKTNRAWAARAKSAVTARKYCLNQVQLRLAQIAREEKQARVARTDAAHVAQSNSFAITFLDEAKRMLSSEEYMKIANVAGAILRAREEQSI